MGLRRLWRSRRTKYIGTAGAAIVAIASVVTIYIGSRGSIPHVSGTIRWDWQQVFPAAKPSARSDFAMVYDSSRDRLVLFGGQKALGVPKFIGETWVFDGSNWTQLSPATEPGARGQMRAAYDVSRDRVVMFGGSTDAATLDETWEFDGTTWAQVAGAATPFARANHQMAYHAATTKVVMFGGFDEFATKTDQTWTYDAAGWVLEAPAAKPSARISHQMAVDSAGNVLLVGGFAASIVSDTWTWDGSNWTLKAGAGAPARAFGAAGYLASAGVTVLTGGFNSIFQIDPTTWVWDGVVWRQITSIEPRPAVVLNGLAGFPAADRVVFFGGNFGVGEFRNFTWELRKNK